MTGKKYIGFRGRYGYLSLYGLEGWMKIIKRGTIDDIDPLMWSTCSKCKSELEARVSELRKVEGRYNEIEYVGICPVCNKSTNFRRKPPSKT